MGNSSLPYEIVHCSSWDDEYNPEQLVQSSPGNQQIEPCLPIKCKGWQTPKCPEYPQDLIIHLLSGTTRITKVQILSHHFKIATKIDVYIGILKDAQDVLLKDIIDQVVDQDQDQDDDNMLIEFTRLGYVCFDNNARAQYRARELKSIKINADGEYIRLVIRNCHRNRLNTYNQVGILALNILGEPLQSSNNNSSQIRHHHPFDDNSILSSSTRRTSVSSNSSNSINKLTLTSGNELELQQWASALFAAEEEAVLNEQYQTAKTYKYLGDKLERFTKILSDLEIGKRHAVETKDYDEAEKIKDDIKEIKQAAQQLLKQSNIQIDGIHVRRKQVEPEEFIIPTSYEQLELDTTIIDYPSPSIMMKESVVVVEQQQQYQQVPQVEEEEEEEQEQEQIIPQTTTITDSDSIPEPIMDEERIPYKLPIHIFGQDIVACVLSVKVKCRKRGLDLIEEYILSVVELHQDQLLSFLMEEEDEEDEEEQKEQDVTTRCVSNFINATLMMIQEAIMDSRELIVLLAISIWQQLLNHVILLQQQPSSNGIDEWMEKTFSGLLKRTSDSNSNIKNASVQLVIELLKSFKLLSTCCICKPERILHNYKEAKLRIELVETITLQIGIFNLQDLMAFVVAYLNHNHQQVKEAAVKLVVTISDQIGFKTVSSYIDQSLLLSLTETVQKIVNDKEFQQREQQQKQKKKVGGATSTKETMSELRALTVQQPESATRKKTTTNSAASKKNTTATKTATTKSRAPTATAAAATKTTRTTRPATSNKVKKEEEKPAPEVVKDENNTCIFCDEMNPEFNEDTLIKHYYNTCPVLTNCPMCQIITEISTLNEHMLMDCDRRHLIKQCTRCKQAIPVEQWLQHTLKQVCKLKKDENDIKCPLCSTQIDPPNETGWKLHLMTGQGCTKLKKSRAPSSSSNKQKKTTGSVRRN